VVIYPIGDQVLIKVDAQEEKSAGGLFLASAEPVVKNSGVVMAIGDSLIIKVKQGDHVIFEKGMGRRFQVPVQQTNDNGVKWTEQVSYILIAYYDVLAVLGK